MNIFSVYGLRLYASGPASLLLVRAGQTLTRQPAAPARSPTHFGALQAIPHTYSDRSLMQAFYYSI